MKYTTAIAVTALSLLTEAAPTGNSSALPIVDLGYVKQQASSIDTTAGYYNFSNIAFAEPPVGDLRFAAPVPRRPISGMQDGNGMPRVCPQAYPIWLAEILRNGQNIPIDPTNTEDCLYLDVFAPQKVFDQRMSKKAPVIVWIYGGGLVTGSKTTDNPRGLVTRGIQNTDSDGAIYVAANYRVGNFGSLGGSDFELQGGAPNVALLDQRLALDWVQKNIHLFGGDADRVTLMGESGGASSIAHQITGNAALSKGRDYPFQQVILQSPAESEPNNNDLANKQFHTFLKAANVSTLAEARKLDTKVLQQANYNLIQQFPYGTFPYSYNIDGRAVHASARKEMLRDECLANDLKAMIAYNLNEGFIFTPQDNTTFETYLLEWLPQLRDDQKQYVEEQLYPASAYSSPFERIDTFIADLLIDCNAAAYEKAFQDSAYAYRFSVPTPGPQDQVPPPGYHIQDLSYTFYDQPNEKVNATIAMDMQTKFVNFAVHGDPNAASKDIAMPRYGSGHQMLDYAGTRLSIVTDENAYGVNKRCEYWDKF